MITKILPLRGDHFDLPDEDLGKLILGLWIMNRAEVCGIDPQNIPQEAARIIVEATQKLPDDNVSSELDTLFLSVRLAANGKFEAAGKKLKSYVHQRAEHAALTNIALNMDDDSRRGAKVRLAASRGHNKTHGDPIEKEIMRRKCLKLMADIRKSNPHLKPHAVYTRAAEKSESVLGEKVSYKKFYRIENPT
ncbi:hypothetical protein [Methylobacter sp. sgz302048]|uniref:hypothetical protein n=1 Tax=Methylobacter sp. sgz302048 TaxID=3455945 RepID=UPI003FA10CFF